MTNREYLEKSLSGLGLSQDDYEIIALKSEIDLEGDVDTKVCDNAIYNRMSVVLSATLQNITEGGYSISWNMEAVKLYYTSLCNEIGKPNILYSKPTIRNRSNVW